MTGAFLEIDGVSRRFGTRFVLNEASLQLGPGDRVTVAGLSGEGKTTLLRLVAGLDAPDAGEIRLDGAPASRRGRVLLPPWKRRTQMVFQNLGLWPTRTVLANVADALRAGGVPRAAARERALASLEKVGLAHEAARHPASLSGGEARRLAFARALAPEPGLLLLDEPFSSLDPVARERGFDFLEEVLAATSAAVILVTHDPAEARALGGKIALLREGRLGAPREQGEWCASESGFRAALESPMEETG